MEYFIALYKKESPVSGLWSLKELTPCSLDDVIYLLFEYEEILIKKKGQQLLMEAAFVLL